MFLKRGSIFIIVLFIRCLHGTQTNVRNMNMEDAEDALKKARNQLAQNAAGETQVETKVVSQAARQHCSFLQPNEKSKMIEEKATALLMATKQLMGDMGKPDAETVKLLMEIHLANLGNVPAPPTIECNALGFYRHMDGTCNNLENPEWGSAHNTFRRILPPVYEDDFENNALDCGSCDSTSSVHPECMPIHVPPGDPTFEDNSCLTFARSLPGQTCFGAREQISQVTAFIDASNVYGSEDSLANDLRIFKNGQLKMQDVNGQYLLPRNSHFGDCEADDKFSCFLAGDERNSEHVGLSSVHTIWVRYHNTIAHRLSRINHAWNDEWVYLEARRIVGALHQHITYNEFLRELLGDKLLDVEGLAPKQYGHTFAYVHDCDPTISNEFATAAYRFGHSLISGLLRVMNSDISVVDLRTAFFNPSFLYKYKQSVDKILFGFINQPAQKVDRFIDDAVRNHLFGGLDLAALNIQRGRDHAIQPWLAYRAHYGLFVPQTFDQLIYITDETAINALRAVYQSVSDIDLFTGILVEEKVPGAMLGETGVAILVEQFKRLKYCDRFFYEHGNQHSSFTLKQLDGIRSIRLCDIFCATLNMSFIQANAFAMPDDSKNRMGTCRDANHLQIELFREQ